MGVERMSVHRIKNQVWSLVITSLKLAPQKCGAFFYANAIVLPRTICRAGNPDDPSPRAAQRARFHVRNSAPSARSANAVIRRTGSPSLGSITKRIVEPNLSLWKPCRVANSSCHL